jgi:D-3-phosphoglycerate dehydrogenase
MQIVGDTRTMDDRFSISLPVRSVDRDGEAYRMLAERFRIVFTNTSGKRLESEELRRSIARADGVIAGTERYSRQVLEGSPRLKVISRVGTGTDNIDLDTAEQRGIVVKNTPDAPVPAVAEHTLALILSALKHIPAYDRQARRRAPLTMQGSNLSGRTLGIIGMGRIGRRVAEMAGCLGCRIIYHDPFSGAVQPGRWERMSRLADLLSEADIITIHAAPQKEQKPILDGNAFQLCRKGVVVINTARPSFIDEEALAAALGNGQVAAAGLDVQSQEPYEGPLLEYDTVILTPHVASNTVESRRMMEMEAARNLMDALGAMTP